MKRDKAKNLMFLINKSVGTEMFQSLYVVDDRNQLTDVTNQGELSCAYYVSSILTIAELMDKPHATVRKVLEVGVRLGWAETKTPHAGDIVEWGEDKNGNRHIGFYIDEKTVVSNSSQGRKPISHGLVMGDGRSPQRFFAHSESDTGSEGVGRSGISAKPALALGRYRHYKGGEYEVLMLAMHEATLRWCVVYRALYDTGDNPKTWIRTYEDFTATLPDGMRRFRKI